MHSDVWGRESSELTMGLNHVHKYGKIFGRVGPYAKDEPSSQCTVQPIVRTEGPQPSGNKLETNPLNWTCENSTASDTGPRPSPSKKPHNHEPKPTTAAEFHAFMSAIMDDFSRTISVPPSQALDATREVCEVESAY